MNYDVDLATLADVIDDPFERREVHRALTAIAEDTATAEEVNILVEHAVPLLMLNNDWVTTALAAIGVPAAIAKRLFGG